MSQRFYLNWGKGARQKVERLLESRSSEIWEKAMEVDINEPRDNYGYTLLHHAVSIECDASTEIRDESEAVTQLIINKGAYLDVRDCCGRTPLMLAVTSNNFKAVKALLNGGASVLLHCKYGKYIFHYTVMNPHHDIPEILIDKGADVNAKDLSGSTILHYAVLDGNEILVDFLMKQESIIKFEFKMDSAVICHANELIQFAFWGRNEAILQLLKKDVDIESRGGCGSTALIAAVRSGKYSTVHLLLEAGADVESRDSLGKTALHWACSLTLADIVKLILEYGADPNVQSKDSNFTPFDYAVIGLKKGVMGQTQRPSPAIAHLLNYGAYVSYCENKTEEKLFFRKCCDESISSRDGNVDTFKYSAHSDYFSPFEMQIFCHDIMLRLARIPSVKSCFVNTKEFNLEFYRLERLLKHNPQFKINCIQEIALMKTTRIGDLNVFSLLSNSFEITNIQLVHKHIENFYEKKKCLENLPIYGGMVEAKLAKIKFRRSLINSSLSFFSFLMPKLPYDCTELILTFLSSEDMMQLRKVVFKYEMHQNIFT